MSRTTRYFLSIGNVAISLFLGVLALACVLIYNETLFLQLQKYAASVRDWMVSFRSWPKAEIVARLVLHDTSILLMFFTLMSRIVVGALIGIVSWIRGMMVR